MVFCLPGSPDAVQTAMELLILPELGHVMRIAREH
jgi:molybdopterin biosynthesis enzyme MoaB